MDYDRNYETRINGVLKDLKKDEVSLSSQHHPPSGTVVFNLFTMEPAFSMEARVNCADMDGKSDEDLREQLLTLIPPAFVREAD